MQRVAPRRPTRVGVPRDRTPFVGRASELAAVTAAFEGGAALVTLSGPGGAGKTRIARRFVAGLGEGVEVLFCDLAEARDENDLDEALARALGLALDRSGAQARQSIGRALAVRGSALVVLDNFEQLVACAAATLELWLSIAPDAQLLATSREPLRLDGEVRIEIGPLSAEDGAALFAMRARAVRPSWDLLDGQRAVVDELVRRLDGLPLAIELAATRCDVLSPEQILSALDARFDLLTRAPRGSGSRHSTLAQALRWSWDLLSPWEQEALAQCSAFRGAFSLEAVEAVLRLSPPAPAALEVVQALRDRSLLSVVEHDPAEPARYRLLESVRAFAAAELAGAGGADEVEIRHAAHFVAAAEACTGNAVRTPSPAQLVRLERLLDELHAIGLRAACPADLRVRAVIALHIWYRARGSPEVDAASMEAMVERAGQLGDRSLQVRALIAAAERRTDRGDLVGARAQVEQAVALAPADGVPSLGARALELEVIILRSMGLFDDALGRADQAVQLHRAAGDTVGEGAALTQRATVLYGAGRVAEAQQEVVRALALLARAGDVRLEAVALAVLASIEHYGGRSDDPSPLYEQAAAASLALDDRRSLCSLWLNLGTLHADHGRRDEANAVLEGALALGREMGDAAREAAALCRLAYIDLEEGRLDQSGRRLQAALAIHDEMRDLERSSVAALGLGIHSHERQEFQEAEAWFERARETASEGNADRILAEGFAAAACADGDQVERAAAQLDSARTRSRPAGEWIRTCLDVIEGVVDAARARAASGDRVAVGTLLARADAVRIAVAAVPRVQVRLAARILARSLVRSRRQVDSAQLPDLEVAADGRWFALAGKPPVTMGRRHASRLVLVRLVAKHLAGPGAGLSVDDVLAAGWPGERPLHESAQARVRNVMRELRDLGLRDFIRTQDDGYLFEPTLVVAWGDERKLLP